MAITPLTTDEVLDSYELNISKRLLRQKFPWVQDIHLADRHNINEYHLIFMDVDIDGEKFLEAHPEASIYPFVYNYFREGRVPAHSFINIFFDDVDATDIEKQLDEILRKVHKSPAIPDELKLPSDRRFAVSGFRIDPNKQSRTYIEMARKAYQDKLSSMLNN